MLKFLLFILILIFGFILLLVYTIYKTFRGFKQMVEPNPTNQSIPGQPKRVRCVVVDKKSLKYLDDRRKILENIQKGSLNIEEAEKQLDDLDTSS